MSSLYLELMQGPLKGVYLGALREAVEGQIDALLGAMAPDDYRRPMLLSLLAAKEFLSGKNEVELGELQEAAVSPENISRVRQITVSLAHGEAESGKRIVAALRDTRTPQHADDIIAGAISTIVLEKLGKAFCECKVLQEGREDEWIAAQSRHTPRIYDNHWHYVNMYMQALEELDGAKLNPDSLRRRLLERTCASLREGLETCLKDRENPPGSRALEEIIKEELARARELKRIVRARG